MVRRKFWLRFWIPWAVKTVIIFIVALANTGWPKNSEEAVSLIFLPLLAPLPFVGAYILTYYKRNKNELDYYFAHPDEDKR